MGARCSASIAVHVGAHIVSVLQDKRWVHFRHEAGRVCPCPGFYLHLDLRRCLSPAVCGILTGTHSRIRDAIVAHPQPLAARHLVQGLLRHWLWRGRSLQRHPSGYDPEHPLLADLKRKDYIALARFTEEQRLCVRILCDVFTETLLTFAPLTRTF